MIFVEPFDVPNEKTPVDRMYREQEIGIVMPVSEESLDLCVQRVRSVIYRRRCIGRDRVYRGRVATKSKNYNCTLRFE